MKVSHSMACAKALAIIFFSLPLLQCTDENLISDSSITTNTTLNYAEDGSALSDDCSACTYVVPHNAWMIDGKALGLKPGSVIGLDARAPYGSLVFRNIVGTFAEPIIIRNCGGVARVNGIGRPYSIKTENSSHFRITGGDSHNVYGIVVTDGNMGVTLDKLSNQFEVDHLEIQNSGFAGIMAKTDPSCDESTWRGNFLMKGIAIHNNYIHDTGGEGIYAGNSFFTGMNTPCGVKLPHEIHYIRIYGNTIRNAGWDGIQLGCATKGADIHANIIENYGVANVGAQNNGIQIGTGTGGVCYNNLVRGGTGNGIIVLGLGDNILYNNVIDRAGNYGIFCDERYTTGPGFRFVNNTILSPAWDGIRLYADEVEMNVIMNNIISNPGNYYTHSYPRKPADAFLYLLSDKVNVQLSNNYFTMDTAALQAQLNTFDKNYRFANTSPVIDKGADISAYGIQFDFNYKSRLKGAGYDIGAAESH